ncbi:MAG: type II secretion system inner membrane protein GspF [Halieaceae bacterium]|jgi:general secretion pathway protein F|nr:type II secretion system inner membrane protein GspF [Halieaceae bacterium]
MPAFRYRALNTGGKLVRGVLEADSERQVRAQLRSQKLRPIEVQTAARAEAANGNLRRHLLPTRIKTGELALMTRQLATLVQSNLPLADCLQAAAEQTRKPRAKTMLLQVRSRVSEGHTLAYALAEYPQVFNEMYRAMVAAGEHAGFLGPVLERLADYAEQRQHSTQKLRMAMIYPFILLGVAVAVIVALMVFVVPELIGIFAQSNRELPVLTKVLIASSDFLRAYALALLAGIVIAVVLFRRLLRDPGRRRRWHALLLKLPGISGLIIALDTARFASTLSILMASGVPLLEALRIAGQVLQNLVLRAASEQVAVQVAEGSSLSKALNRAGPFPPMMVHMVASGESSGELENMLERSAQNQERELEMTLGTVLGLFEPLMVVFMGGMVLLIVLAILLPIFDLNTMVR